MGNAEKLSALGVKDEDLIMMVSNATSRYAEKLLLFVEDIDSALLDVVGV